jgi:DNA-directed RNA polymerase subunit RPC12/RpoP
MIQVEASCVNCKKKFIVDVLQPPETRYASCPHCGAPHRFDVAPRRMLTPGPFADLLGRKQ